MKRELRELIVMMTDAYKLFHRQMYPSNTITVYSNGTPRASKHYKGKNKDYVVVFGTQRLVRKLRDEFQEFFDLPEAEVIAFCKEQLSSFTGTDYDVDHILYLHRLQKLPLVVKSLPEGTMCPIRVPYMTFYNTDPKCFWLTNYLETYISCETWACITNATIANEYREIFEKWATKTVGNIDFVPFQGHDFSMRGMFGTSAATMSGLAHLTSFCGSDTIPAYLDAQYYYDSGQNNFANGRIVATSVPATEHSVQCAHYDPSTILYVENKATGEKIYKDITRRYNPSTFEECNPSALKEYINNDDYSVHYGDESDYLRHILEVFPKGIVSIVCDGYDFWRFLTIIVPMFKDMIMSRDGKVVFRPDSGNPTDIICGIHGNGHKGAGATKDYADYFSEATRLYKNVATEAEYKGAIEILWEIFGGTQTDKGRNLLDSHVGLIYGDSITMDSADEICRRLDNKNFASINWVGGIGSYTYQFNTRDSHGQAIKATYVEARKEVSVDYGDGDGMLSTQVVGKAIFKDPKTGDGLKKSAKGLISVEYGQDGQLRLIDEVSWERERGRENVLEEILRDGQLKNQTTLQEIRGRLRSYGKTN